MALHIHIASNGVATVKCLFERVKWTTCASARLPWCRGGKSDAGKGMAYTSLIVHRVECTYMNKVDYSLGHNVCTYYELDDDDKPPTVGRLCEYYVYTPRQASEKYSESEVGAI